MLEILAYSIGIMYTPGPANLIGLKSGIHHQGRAHLGFFMGIASAMLLLFLLFGYVGLRLIPQSLLPILTLAGCLYIVYIAVKIMRARITVADDAPSTRPLSYSNGLLMQLLNPKSLAATLPITTIQFPMQHITGSAIAVWSLILAVLAFGAPFSYALLGERIGKHIRNPTYFRLLNVLMAGLLIAVALEMGYTQWLRVAA